MEDLRITDEEGTVLRLCPQVNGTPGLFSAHLAIESKCGNWDSTVYLSRENEEAILRWLSDRKTKRKAMEWGPV